jgi:hypothetical protein
VADVEFEVASGECSPTDQQSIEAPAIHEAHPGEVDNHAGAVGRTNGFERRLSPPTGGIWLMGLWSN